jgi:hypothetical protein
VLRRRELVGRRERSVDGADVEESPIRRRLPADVLGDVGERHQRLALGHDGQHPLGHVEDAQASDGETTLDDAATGRLIHDVRPLEVEILARNRGGSLCGDTAVTFVHALARPAPALGQLGNSGPAVP